ncbi:hypothetical protein [Streptomyces sp. NPDC004008]
MDTDDAPGLTEALRRLARALGRTDDPATEEHDRWALYRAAVGVPAARPPLFEGVPGADRSAGLRGGRRGARAGARERPRAMGRRLPPSVRKFPARRARELGVLAALERGAVPAETVGDQVGDWSDWLQRGAVRVSGDSEVLRVLSREGRTKRIRQAALDALHERQPRLMRQGPAGVLPAGP